MADWLDPQPVSVPDALLEAVGGHPLVATALVRRGITTPAVARSFLDPGQYAATPATELADMDRAVERVWRALTTGERIAIWGDFDADGQTATALLVEGLQAISSAVADRPGPPLQFHVPASDQGHGITIPALDELLDAGVTLLLTCDTGVDAYVAVGRAAARGCNVVVTDHHDLPDYLPPVYALVNPKQLPKDHALRELSGVGVAYKLVEHLSNRAGAAQEPLALLDLVALGIVADVATQVADVRYLLQRGLETLRRTSRLGLQAAAEQAELHLPGVTEEHISYQLAPRLNAMGRLGHASQAVELLLTQDPVRAGILAAEMEGLNHRRRLIAGQVFQAALAQVERDPQLLDYRALVVAGRDWHTGVLGQVAGRLAERFHRPAVVISIARDGSARGSARSVSGCDIHAALRRSSAWLLRFGGHPGAAGLALDASNLEAFRNALSRSVEAVWDRTRDSERLQIDAYVAWDQLSLDLVAELERLAPFGPGNPTVQLASRDLTIVRDALIGREGEHRRLMVADEGGTQQTVLWWQGADQSLPEARFDLAYTLRARNYRGEMQLQIEWIGARQHMPPAVSSRPARTVVDWRLQVDPARTLATLPPAGVVVWAEAEQVKLPAEAGEIASVDRLGLAARPALVVWTAPAGPAELAEALHVVSPLTVYLVGLEPATTDLRLFLERLAGMVKHDLQAHSGQVNLRRLAAALGHREVTIRAGLEWMTVRGQVHIVAAGGEMLVLETGGVQSPDLQGSGFRLRRLLDETAAYRRHFRAAPVSALGI